MKKTLLWLDDCRDPLKNDWLIFSPIGRDVHVDWIMTYEDFIMNIMVNGLPDAICFDHDLGSQEKTGYDCAKWLVDYCMTFGKKLPAYGIQSANSVGRENIDKLLKNYIIHVQEGQK